MTVLNVRADGDKVLVRVGEPISGETYHFSFNAGSSWAARLLSFAIDKALGEVIREARAKAYADGWRDAKAKRAKQVHFSTWWVSK
jgi:hypothetical protein